MFAADGRAAACFCNSGLRVPSPTSRNLNSRSGRAALALSKASITPSRTSPVLWLPRYMKVKVSRSGRVGSGSSGAPSKPLETHRKGLSAMPFSRRYSSTWGSGDSTSEALRHSFSDNRDITLASGLFSDSLPRWIRVSGQTSRIS